MPTSAIRLIDPSNSRALREFIALERQLVGHFPQFVSDIDADVENLLSGRSAFTAEMDYALWIGSENGKDCARIAALINPRYQAAKQEPVGFIGYFAAAPGCPDTVQTLFAEAEAWLHAHGVTRIIAPFQGSAFFGMGLLTADFDHDPMFPFPWHPPYYKDYLKQAQFQARHPLWRYSIDFQCPPYRAAKERVSQNPSVVVRPFNKSRWDDEIATFRHLMNETFKNEWEFHPHTLDEFHEFWDPRKTIMDPNQLLIGEVDGKPAGWCLGVGDWTPLFRSFQGKIGFLEILKLLWHAKRYRRAGLLGIGVLPKFHGNGLARNLAFTLFDYFERRGLQEAYYYLVNDDNVRSRGFAESLGGQGEVIYHAYDKTVTAD